MATKRAVRFDVFPFANLITNLSHVDLRGELPRRRPVGGEDGGAVAVRVVVDELDRLLQSINAQNAKNRSEDLFFVRLNNNI